MTTRNHLQFEDLAESRNENARHIPRLLKRDKVLKVISRGTKQIVDSDAKCRVDVANIDDFPRK
jgi:hypothetical protein